MAFYDVFVAALLLACAHGLFVTDDMDARPHANLKSAVEGKLAESSLADLWHETSSKGNKAQLLSSVRKRKTPPELKNEETGGPLGANINPYKGGKDEDNTGKQNYYQKTTTGKPSGPEGLDIHQTSKSESQASSSSSQSTSSSLFQQIKNQKKQSLAIITRKKAAKLELEKMKKKAEDLRAKADALKGRSEKAWCTAEDGLKAAVDLNGKVKKKHDEFSKNLKNLVKLAKNSIKAFKTAREAAYTAATKQMLIAKQNFEAQKTADEQLEKLEKSGSKDGVAMDNILKQGEAAKQEKEENYKKAKHKNEILEGMQETQSEMLKDIRGVFAGETQGCD